MLLFEPLYDTIIQQLIEHKWVNIQKLHTFVTKEQQISLPNFYKVIGKLLDAQIIIKEHGKLLLHSRRVLWFLDLAERLKTTYLTEQGSVTQLQEGQALYYEATSIASLDGVRGDWMLQVNQIYGTQEPTYVYQARPYYALGMYKTEMAFFTQVHKVAEVYFLAGNTCFLDTYGTNLYTEIGIQAVATTDVPFIRDGYCVTVIGDYVFEVLYPKEISDYFKIFFDTIKDIKDFNEALFRRIFEMKANCKLTLRRDPIQAKHIKKVFEKAFKNKI
jgi:hypothetical protein